MLTFEEIRAANKNGDFYAIGSNGHKYDAVYLADARTMFFCIPSSVQILGYIER